MVAEIDWGESLDDMDSEFWENQTTEHEDDAPSSSESDMETVWYGEPDTDETICEAPAPYWPQVRNFPDYGNASDFLKFATKNGDLDAKMVPFEQGFQVLYRNWSPDELSGYRTGRKYSNAEVKFIVREYLMWNPVDVIAKKVDRKKSAIAFLLSSRDLRVHERNPAYGIGNLEKNCYEELCEAIERGWGFPENGKLRELKILSESSFLNAQQASRKYVQQSDITAEEKRRLMNFTWDYDRLDLASKFATEIGENKLGFLMGLQSSAPTKALLALDSMQDIPIWLFKLKEATRAYVRSIVLRKLPVILDKWIVEANKRKHYYEASAWSPHDDIIGEQLLCAMGTPLNTWSKELQTIYKYFATGQDRAAELNNPDDKFAAWMLSDDLRRSAGNSSSYNDSIRESELKIEKLDLICNDYEPNLKNIRGQLEDALPYDAEIANRITLNLSNAC